MLFERQAVFGYFFYIELVEMWPEKSDKITSVSQSETKKSPAKTGLKKLYQN